MTVRSRSKFVVFSHPFELKGVDRILPPADYRVVTDEVLIEELSFPVYRRISTMIFLPGQGRHASSLEMMTIDPRDLEAAQGPRPVQRINYRRGMQTGKRQNHRSRSASRNGGSDVRGSPSAVGDGGGAGLARAVWRRIWRKGN
jgi:hypothetical protein